MHNEHLLSENQEHQATTTGDIFLDLITAHTLADRESKQGPIETAVFVAALLHKQKNRVRHRDHLFRPDE